MPSIHTQLVHRVYRPPAVHRTFAAMTRLYLQRAGFPVPDELEALRA